LLVNLLSFYDCQMSGVKWLKIPFKDPETADPYIVQAEAPSEFLHL